MEYLLEDNQRLMDFLEARTHEDTQRFIGLLEAKIDQEWEAWKPRQKFAGYLADRIYIPMLSV